MKFDWHVVHFMPAIKEVTIAYNLEKIIYMLMIKITFEFGLMLKTKKATQIGGSNLF